MKWKLVLLTGLLLTVSACKQTKVDLVLKTQVVEAGERLNGCTLVASLNGINVSDDMISINGITFPSGTLECSSSQFGSSEKLKALGEHVLVYGFKGQKIERIIELVDTTPPVIHVEDGVFNVQQDNEYFNLLDIVAVTDNHTDRVDVGLQGSYDLSNPGTYQVTVIAQDDSKNISKKELSVNVLQKEVITIIEKESVIVEVPQHQTPGNTGSGGNQDNGTSPETPAPQMPSQAPASKDFLFSEGFNIDTGMEACRAYVAPYVGVYPTACRGIKQGQINIGIQATFN